MIIQGIPSLKMVKSKRPATAGMRAIAGRISSNSCSGLHQDPSYLFNWYYKDSASSTIYEQNSCVLCKRVFLNSPRRTQRDTKIWSVKGKIRANSRNSWQKVAEKENQQSRKRISKRSLKRFCRNGPVTVRWVAFRINQPISEFIIPT